MFDMEERKRDEDLERSEAMIHFKREQDLTAEKLPENYRPHGSEKDEQYRPRELLHMGNSYGNVSVAANRNKEMFLTISHKRQHNAETLRNDQRKLNGPRRRSVPHAIGWAFTNSFDPVNSAFAFKTRKLQPSKRMLAYINKHVDKNGQDTVETILPFLRLEKDKKKLQELISEISRARQEGQNLSILEREKEQLSKAIFQKEQMQAQFLKKMQFAIKKARIVTEPEHIAWLSPAVFTEGMSSSDKPDGDEEGLVEGLVEGLLGAIQGKDKSKKEKKN